MKRKRISTAVNEYLKHLSTRDDLKKKTVEDYSYWATRLRKEFGDREIALLKESEVMGILQDIYEKGNVRTAELLRVAGRRLYVFLKSCGYKGKTPFGDKRIEHEQRTQEWSHSEVEQLLHHLYSMYHTTNAGIIVHVIYETSFSVTEARELKWENIDIEDTDIPLITIGDKTCMISSDLVDVLKQQYERFDFQEYVAPSNRVINGKYQPLRADAFATICRNAMNEIGIRDELRIADLVYNPRRSGDGDPSI